MSILTDMFDEKYDAWERAVGGCSFWYHARQKPETQAIMADGRMWLAVLLMKLQDQGEDPSPLLCALCDEVAFGRGNGFAEFCEKEVVPGMVAVDTVSATGGGARAGAFAALLRFSAKAAGAGRAAGA